MRWGDCGLALPSPNLRHRAGKSGKSELAQLRPELQDVSIAGNQEGLQGSRSSLVRCVFETLDRTGGCGPELGFRLLLCGHTDFHHTVRWFAILENVANLLSVKMRPVFLFVLQVTAASNAHLRPAQLPCYAQEAYQRGLRVRWTSASGRSVGAHVRSSAQTEWSMSVVCC